MPFGHRPFASDRKPGLQRRLDLKEETSGVVNHAHGTARGDTGDWAPAGHGNGGVREQPA